MLTLETRDGLTGFAPGQTIHGRVAWQLDAAPRNPALRLVWHTEGRGTKDVYVVHEIPLPAAAVHESEFSIALPETPYSFSGKLISLRWALELVLNRGKDVARVDIVVSPWETEVLLGSAEVENR